MALSTLAGACLLMGLELRANRIAAAMLGAGAWWAACEVLWNAVPDPATALLLHRVAAPGFCFVGPLGLLFVLEVAEAPMHPRRWLIGGAFGACFAAMLLCFAGPHMLSRMQPVAWGHALVPGPVYPIWTAGSALAIGLSAVWWVRDYRASTITFTRRQGPLVAQLVIPVAALGLATDGLLPILGIQLPRLGTIALAGFGVIIVTGFSRYGYSRLHPQAFAMRALHTLPDGIALTTLHGRIRVANERFGDLVGGDARALVGGQIGAYLDRGMIDPPREQRDVECQLRRLDGTVIPVCVSTAPLDAMDGVTPGVVLVLQDLREVSALRSRLAVSGRLAAVGQLAAGIAHEINNPLAFVRSNLALLRREWERFEGEARKRDAALAGELDEWPELLDESIEGVDRASTIVRDIRGLSHAGGLEPELADLSQVLDQVLRVAKVQLDAGVRVETDYAAGALVSCDPQRLKQVFLNLVLNAGHAITPPGRIQVSTLATPEWVEARIADDGCGMAPAVRERIFDPFFTTKPVGRGTGLGLSLAWEIVRNHGGEIWCESEPGAGSTFHVRLPRHPGRDPARPGEG
jgi:signal transduction histidine kinase